MSSYYTQNTSGGNQPTMMNYSTWSGKEETDASPSPMVPEPPVQRVHVEDPNATKLSREHFRTARDNALANTTPPANSSGVVPPESSGPLSESWAKKYWFVWLILGIVVIGIAGFFAFRQYNVTHRHSGGAGSGLAASTSSVSAAAPPTFGSGALGLDRAAGILNDLEFL